MTAETLGGGRAGRLACAACMLALRCARRTAAPRSRRPSRWLCPGRRDRAWAFSHSSSAFLPIGSGAASGRPRRRRPEGVRGHCFAGHGRFEASAFWLHHRGGFGSDPADWKSPMRSWPADGGARFGLRRALSHVVFTLIYSFIRIHVRGIHGGRAGGDGARAAAINSTCSPASNMPVPT